jgi:hypothetical protein
MHRRRFAILSGVLLAAAPAVVFAVLMHRTQTGIDVPSPGQVVELSGLIYKGSAFQASVTSVRFDSKSEEGAEKVEAEWVFLAQNSDGQMHKIEIFVRPLDEAGKQLGSFSVRAILTPGARSGLHGLDGPKTEF